MEGWGVGSETLRYHLEIGTLHPCNVKRTRIKENCVVITVEIKAVSPG